MNRFHPFGISRLPRIEFGRGRFATCAEHVQRYGKRVLLVTGRRSFAQSPFWDDLQQSFAQQGIHTLHCRIETEPSPHRIDEAVNEFRDRSIELVLGIGGGSVLDAAKAIAGLLRIENSVMDFLEGVGPQLPYQGPAVPFIAVPTTAGTGSEATKNAVLSVQGEAGFKKSFRDERLVAELAIVDSALLAGCPARLIAANGMDALTQLIESYVSSKANVMIDALCISALRAARDGLLEWYQHGSTAEVAQDRMAYAAMTSGMTLAQVGLGSVHGLASPLGAFYPIGHGVVCGSLLAVATSTNIEVMLARDANNPALDKYARLGDVLCEKRHGRREASWQALVDRLHDWTTQMQLPGLRTLGVRDDDLDKIVQHSRGSSMQTNPVTLRDEEIKSILLKRMVE